MVSQRCKTVVRENLKKLGLHFIVVDLGEVDIMEDLTGEQLQELKSGLQDYGLELMDNKKGVLVQRIKNTIREMINQTSEETKIIFSEFLSKKLDCEYAHLANLFSEVQGTTIEQYIIAHKVERIKEFIYQGELNMTEIALQMNYSSVAHFSSQFKKVTGISPSQFKQLQETMRSSEVDNKNNNTK